MTDETHEEAENEKIDSLFENEPTDAETEPEKEDVVDAEGSPGEESLDSEETEPPSEESEKEPPKEPTLVPVAALQDVRRRAQKLEDENKSLRSQLPQTDNEPDMYDDPEGWKTFHLNKMETTHQKKQEAEYVVRVEEQRSAMLEKHDDYPAAEEATYARALQDPDFKQQLLNSSDPALFAYEQGKDMIKANKEAIRQEILAEMNPSKETPETSIAAPSLATASATGSNSTEIEKDEDIDDMFEDQKY